MGFFLYDISTMNIEQRVRSTDSKRLSIQPYENKGCLDIRHYGCSLV